MNIKKLSNDSKYCNDLTTSQLRTLFIYLFTPGPLMVDCLDTLEVTNKSIHREFILKEIFSNYNPAEIDSILESEKWITLN